MTTRRTFIYAAGRRGGRARSRLGRSDRSAVRRIGVLTSATISDATSQARYAALLQGLGLLGWDYGRNTRVDYRWAAETSDSRRDYATELVALAPDVILATGGVA